MRRLLQLFCNHKWTPWKLYSYQEGHYDEEIWWTRYCTRCGKVENQECVETDEHIVGGK